MLKGLKAQALACDSARNCSHARKVCTPCSLLRRHSVTNTRTPYGNFGITRATFTQLCRLAAAGQHEPGVEARQAPPSKEPTVASSVPDVPDRLLGVDYGRSTTGLAVGRSGVCSPLKVIPTPTTAKLSDVARQILAEALAQGVTGVMVGIPIKPGGSIFKPHTDSPMGARCRSLAHTLALLGKQHGMPVYLYDETNTTRAVVKTLGYNWQDRMSYKEKMERRVDADSAAMLLRLYYSNPGHAIRIKPRVT
ncbi:hypothetical protein Agub_g804, partial [Astrephomene gubernaculifera]